MCVTNPIVHDSVGHVKGGGKTWGVALLPPGRQFAWANDDNSTNHINQQLTGMSGSQLTDIQCLKSF